MGYHEQFVYSKSGNINSILNCLPINNAQYDLGFDIICGVQTKQNINIDKVILFGQVIDVNVNVPKGVKGVLVGSEFQLAQEYIPFNLKHDIRVVNLDSLCNYNYSSMLEDQEITYKGKTYLHELDEHSNSKVDYVEGEDNLQKFIKKYAQQLGFDSIEDMKKSGITLDGAESSSQADPAVEFEENNFEEDTDIAGLEI